MKNFTLGTKWLFLFDVDSNLEQFANLGRNFFKKAAKNGGGG